MAVRLIRSSFRPSCFILLARHWYSLRSEGLKRVFRDVQLPGKIIVIDPRAKRRSELVVGVDNPELAMKLIQNAL